MVTSVGLAAVGGMTARQGFEGFITETGRLALNDDIRARCRLFYHFATQEVPRMLSLGLGELIGGRFLPGGMLYSVVASMPLSYVPAGVGCMPGTVKAIEWTTMHLDEHLTRLREGEMVNVHGYSTKISASFREYASPLCGPADRPLFVAEELGKRLSGVMTIWNLCVLSAANDQPFSVEDLIRSLDGVAGQEAFVGEMIKRKTSIWGYDMRLITRLDITPGDGGIASIRVECMDAERIAVRQGNGAPPH